MHVPNTEIKTSVKLIGLNGQISLGKEFAGEQVLVEEREPGVWVIRTALVIPKNELWLHQLQAKKDLEQAMVWAQNNPPQETDLDVFLAELSHDKKTKPRSARSE